MFIWRASTIMEQMAEYLPMWHSGLMEISAAIGSANEEEATSRVFHAQKGISIDYAVMERAPNVVVVRGSFGWSDVGSWDEVWRLHYHDEDGNAFRGNAITVGSRNTLVLAQEKFIGVVGVENLIVVDTDDALLICRMDNSQQVRDLVEAMEKSGKAKHL
jgi:mannose-1-phosphate guanylyltransferase